MKYPVEPHAANTSASQEGAEIISKKVVSLREKVIEILSRHWLGLTAEQIGIYINPHKTAEEARKWINPRISELRAMGQVKDSRNSGKSSNGVKATVWVLGRDETYLKKRLCKKPVGDPVLWGKMMQACYAYAHDASEENEDKRYAATFAWQQDLTVKIRKGIDT